MEHKNENNLLSLKNYYSFLIDLGINISINDIKKNYQEEINLKKTFDTIQEIDGYIKDWQIKNNIYLISRNINFSSEILLVMRESSSINNFNHLLIKDDYELLKKMFESIEQDVKNIFIVNINEENKFTFDILNLYISKLKPKYLIDMTKNDMNISKLKVSSIFKIPSPSSINNNYKLKRVAWTQLKLLKEIIDEN